MVVYFILTLLFLYLTLISSSGLTNSAVSVNQKVDKEWPYNHCLAIKCEDCTVLCSYYIDSPNTISRHPKDDIVNDTITNKFKAFSMLKRSSRIFSPQKAITKHNLLNTNNKIYSLMTGLPADISYVRDLINDIVDDYKEKNGVQLNNVLLADLLSTNIYQFYNMPDKRPLLFTSLLASNRELFKVEYNGDLQNCYSYIQSFSDIEEKFSNYNWFGLASHQAIKQIVSFMKSCNEYTFNNIEIVVIR